MDCFGFVLGNLNIYDTIDINAVVDELAVKHINKIIPRSAKISQPLELSLQFTTWLLSVSSWYGNTMTDALNLFLPLALATFLVTSSERQQRD